MSGLLWLADLELENLPSDVPNVGVVFGVEADLLALNAPSFGYWSLDFVMDTLVSGRRFRILTLVDDLTRECLGARLGAAERQCLRDPTCEQPGACPGEPRGARHASVGGRLRRVGLRVPISTQKQPLAVH